MKQDQYNNMTPEQINEKIARILGWHPSPGNNEPYLLCGEWRIKSVNPYHPDIEWFDKRRKDELPNYCGDLNAMAEAVNSLTDAQCDQFNDILWDIMNGKKYLWNGSAFQYAEAFLRIHNQWTKPDA